MNFKPLRPLLKIGPYLQGKKGQNKPENPQNWNMAKIAPKSDKFTKSIFFGPKMATFAKSANLWDQKNGTSSGQIKILRPLL